MIFIIIKLKNTIMEKNSNIDDNLISKWLFSTNSDNKDKPENQIIKRVFECALCNSKTHSITKCYKYRELKKNLENRHYIKFNTNKLNENEEQAFCASGIIPYVRVENKVYLLVLIECRNKLTGLNFIGGKRECIFANNAITPETSYETAFNELKEELGEILTNESANLIIEQISKCEIPNFVFWSGNSKMCLYGIKLPNNFLFSLNLNNNDKLNTEAEGFKWIRYNGHGYMEKKSNTYKLHKYSKCMLNSMKKLSSNNNLDNLFT